MSIFNQKMAASERNEAELRGYLLAMSDLEERVDLLEEWAPKTNIKTLRLDGAQNLLSDGLESLKFKYGIMYLKHGGCRLRDKSLCPSNLKMYRHPETPENVPENVQRELSLELWRRFLSPKP